jgi:hypothetical protein
MMRSHNVHQLAVAVVAALSLALAACGDESADAGSVDGAGGATGLDAATSRTLDARTMAFELELSVDAFGQTQESTITGRGEFDNATGEVSVTSPEEDVHAIVDTDGFWVTSDAAEFVDSMPDGATWVRGSFAEMGDSEVIVPLEPPALLYLLEGATNERSQGGDGEESYSFDIDVARAVSQAPAHRRDEVEQLMWWSGDVALDARGEVVIGEDGRIRTLIAEGTVTGEAGGAPPATLRWHASFDEFDQEVTIDPPNDDDVVDLADVPDLRTNFFGL